MSGGECLVHGHPRNARQRHAGTVDTHGDGTDVQGQNLAVNLLPVTTGRHGRAWINASPCRVRRVAENLLLRFRHFRHPWRSAGTLLLRFRHFRHPWRSRVLPRIRLPASGLLRLCVFSDVPTTGALSARRRRTTPTQESLRTNKTRPPPRRSVSVSVIMKPASLASCHFHLRYSFVSIRNSRFKEYITTPSLAVT